MRFVCAGDAGVDRYDDLAIDHPGGIGLNVAVHMRRRARPADSVTIVAPVGDDDEAGIVRDAIARTGLEGCLEVVSGPTPVQHIRHRADGERVFAGFEEGVLAGYRVSDRQRAAIASSDVLATTAFGQGLAFFDSVMGCEPGGVRAVDFTNLSDVGDPIPFVERWAPALDIGLFGLQPSDTALIGELEAVARRSGRLFLVTLGPAGAVALGGGQRIACPAPPVADVTDTTGAGDAFTAGFLCEYARGRDVARSLASGVAVAASTLGHLSSFELPV